MWDHHPASDIWKSGEIDELITAMRLSWRDWTNRGYLKSETGTCRYRLTHRDQSLIDDGFSNVISIICYRVLIEWLRHWSVRNGSQPHAMFFFQFCRCFVAVLFLLLPVLSLRLLLVLLVLLICIRRDWNSIRVQSKRLLNWTNAPRRMEQCPAGWMRSGAAPDEFWRCDKVSIRKRNERMEKLFPRIEIQWPKQQK